MQNFQVTFCCIRAWLYLYARGVDHETVSDRRLPKSIGCNKNFTGLAALDTKEKISHWLLELCAEVVERLDKDKETVFFFKLVIRQSASCFVLSFLHFNFYSRITGQPNY